jgi:hypothetical protein
MYAAWLVDPSLRMIPSLTSESASEATRSPQVTPLRPQTSLVLTFGKEALGFILDREVESQILTQRNIVR